MLTCWYAMGLGKLLGAALYQMACCLTMTLSTKWKSCSVQCRMLNRYEELLNALSLALAFVPVPLSQPKCVLQGYEQVIVLTGHDRYRGQVLLFNSSERRAIERESQRLAEDPKGWRIYLHTHQDWLVAKPVKSLLETWLIVTEKTNSNPKVTVILDCCHSAAELDSISELEVAGQLQERQVAVFAACAADRLASTMAFCSLLCGDVRGKASILERQCPQAMISSSYVQTVSRAQQYTAYDFPPVHTLQPAPQPQPFFPTPGLPTPMQQQQPPPVPSNNCCTIC